MPCHRKTGLHAKSVYLFVQISPYVMKLNSLRHMPILGSSNSAANKDMMS